MIGLGTIDLPFYMRAVLLLPFTCSGEKLNIPRTLPCGHNCCL